MPYIITPEYVSEVLGLSDVASLNSIVQNSILSAGVHLAETLKDTLVLETVTDLYTPYFNNPKAPIFSTSKGFIDGNSPLVLEKSVDAVIWDVVPSYEYVVDTELGVLSLLYPYGVGTVDTLDYVQITYTAGFNVSVDTYPEGVFIGVPQNIKEYVLMLSALFIQYRGGGAGMNANIDTAPDKQLASDLIRKNIRYKPMARNPL